MSANNTDSNSRLRGSKRDSTDLLSTTNVNDNTANPRPSKRQRQSTHKNHPNSSQKLEKNENVLIPQNNINKKWINPKNNNSIPTNAANMSDEESNEESNEDSIGTADEEQYNAQNRTYTNSEKNMNPTIGQIHQQPPHQVMYRQPPHQQVLYRQPPHQQVMYGQPPPQQVVYGRSPLQQVQYVQQLPPQEVQYGQPPPQQIQYQQNIQQPIQPSMQQYYHNDNINTTQNHTIDDTIQTKQDICCSLAISLIYIVLSLALMSIVLVVLYELYHPSDQFKSQWKTTIRKDCKTFNERCGQQLMKYIVGYYDDLWFSGWKVWYEKNTQFAAMWIMCAIWTIVLMMRETFSAALEMKILLMLILLVIIDVYSNQSALFNLLYQALGDENKRRFCSMYYNNELTVHMVIALRLIEYFGNCFVHVQIICYVIICYYFVLLYTEISTAYASTLYTLMFSIVSVDFDNVNDLYNIIYFTLTILLWLNPKANRTYRTVFYYVLLILPLAIDSKSRYKYTKEGIVERWLGGDSGEVYIFEGLWKQIPWVAQEMINRDLLRMFGIEK